MDTEGFVPLPSLKLSYKKDTSISSSSNPIQTTTQNQQMTNQINIVVPKTEASSDTSKTIKTRSFELDDLDTSEISDTNIAKVEDSAAKKATDNATKKTKETALAEEQNERVLAFKDRLIEIQTELLLCNASLVKNLIEFSSYVIYLKEDLQELIGILVLPKESRLKFASLIEIETEPIRVQKFCCNFKHSLFEQITEITVNNTENFLGSEIATKMEKLFKISLKRCIVNNM
jgi:hypothetical protein